MKVGIVNSSDQIVEMLQQLVLNTSTHQVVWTARNGADAVRQCATATPELVLMDLNMPEMSGVEATRRIMASSPCAVLIVTVTVSQFLTQVYEALSVGAVDVVDLTNSGEKDASSPTQTLLLKIEQIDKLLRGRRHRTPSGPVAKLSDAASDTSTQITLVVVGASAGGPAALATMLHALPSNLPAPIIIVQHVDARFAAGMAEWLSRSSSIPVRVARPLDRPSPGTVLMAGTDEHLAFIGSTTLGYVQDPGDVANRPSVDVLFRSVVRYWQGPAIGVLLTGMGRDGARGLKLLHDAGGFTIAQDQQTSVVYGMPHAAAQLGGVTEVLPIDKIGPRVAAVAQQSLHPLRRQT